MAFFSGLGFQSLVCPLNVFDQESNFQLFKQTNKWKKQNLKQQMCFQSDSVVQRLDVIQQRPTCIFPVAAASLQGC